MMSRRWFALLALVVCLAAAWWIARLMNPSILPVTPPTDGISRALATERASSVTSVRYALTLTIPDRIQDEVAGVVTVRFNLARRAPVVLDFAQPASAVLSIASNGRSIPVRVEHGHLIVPSDTVAQGENSVEIHFTAGSQALNRDPEYLYSLFVPARASQTFPCFDQPDIKASLTLGLDVPADWVAVANSPEIGRETRANRTLIRFGATPALPTYLFGFAAGRFTVERGERNGRPFFLYHRETDAAKVAANREAIFDLHQQSLDWLEMYTARKYPFDKLDFVLLPSFQFMGMEHAGAIFYNAGAMLLDKTATQDQQLTRASIIAHETSHMWFGDLVTMKWFDDVWLKEVFANFMASKIVDPSFPDIDHELLFFHQHYGYAYDVDRSAGANAIRQPLDNLSDAGSLYGPIIYHKAPIVMRQLEATVGAEELRDGLREYLTRFAFSNATWGDLIQILDGRTEADLASWSRIWIDEPGRPTITTTLDTEVGKISRLTFSQADPAGRSRLWPQQLQVALGYETGARISGARMTGASLDVPKVNDLPVPNYVLPNAEGSGYGLFRPDEVTRKFFLARLPDIGDALTRATAWLTLWDDLLEGGTPPQAFFDLALRALPEETEQQNTERLLDYMSETYWRFLSDAQRAAVAARLEQALLGGLKTAKGASLKAAYFSAYRRTVTSRSGVQYLERVWRRQESIADLPFAEPDYIAMAESLALRQVPATDAIITEQLARITNPDRKARFTFIAPALSPDPSVRDAFFANLAAVENRAREPWVVDALRYLNHPLRRAHAVRYIDPGLKLVRDIQRTGDIFFPTRWTSALLSGHNSPAAASTVSAFLAAEKDYPPRLRQAIEQSSDLLFRAAKLVK